MIIDLEMFHNIQTADDIPAYEAYWCREIRESSKRTKSKGKGTFIVKAYRDGFNVGALPYSLVTAVDMGSFGCMSFQMLSGQELIPTDINQIVVLGHMHKAATWTDDKLSQRIETFIVDEDAQDLVKRLLVVNPSKRLSVTDALNHSYFSGMRDTSLAETHFEGFVQNQKTIESKLESLSKIEVSRSQLQEQMTLGMTASILQLGHDVTFGQLEARDVTMDATTASSFLSHLWDAGKKLQATKGTSVGDIILQLNAGDPLYHYLIDEDTGKVVVPDENDKSLKIATTCAACLQRLHVVPTSHTSKTEVAKNDWTKEVDRTIAGLSEPTALYQVLQEVLNVDESVEFVRGAALRDLEQCFGKHDPNRWFAGLKRVIKNQGRVVWTTLSLAEEDQADKEVNKKSN
ncbi:hypothetical protein As57867_006863, partial [Aphanomyces stellatus]